MNNVITTTDTTIAQVKELSIAVRDIATDKGVGVNALAEGLYFVRSAGLETVKSLNGVKNEAGDTAQTLDILTQGASLSAIGFGDVSDSLKSLTSLMSAYRESNLSAAQASGLLLGAVKAGKAEANEFTKAIGDFIPVAAAFGVAAADAVALEATLTRSGQSASESATQVRALVTSLVELQTTTDIKKLNVLDKYKISAKQVAEAIKGEGGLTATLAEFQKILGGNTADLNTLFDNARASRGIFVAFQNDFQGAYDLVSQNNIGVLLAQQLKIEDTAVRQFDLLKAGVQAALIEIGQKFIPVIVTLVDSVRPLGPVFKALVITFGEIIGFIAPLAKIIVPFVVLTTTVSALSSGFKALNIVSALQSSLFVRLTNIQNNLINSGIGASSSISRMQNSLVAGGAAATALSVATFGVTAAITIGLVVWQNYKKKQEEVRQAVKDVTVALLEGKTSVEAFDGAVKNLFDKDKKRDLLLSIGLSKDKVDTMTELQTELSRVRDRIIEINAQRTGKSESLTPGLEDELRRLSEGFTVLDAELSVFESAFEQKFLKLVASGNLQNLGLENSFKELNGQLNGTSTSIATKLTPAYQGLALKIGTVADATQNYELRNRFLDVVSKDTYNNTTELSAAFVANVAATNGADSALAKLAVQLTGVSVQAAKAKAEIQGFQAQTLEEFLDSSQFKDIKALGDAGRSLDKAKADSVEASDRLKEAEIELSNAKKAQVADIADQEKAERQRVRALRDANKGIESAKQAIVTADEGIVDAKDKAAKAREDIENKGVLGVKKAVDAAVEATEKRVKAEKDSAKDFAEIALKQQEYDTLAVRQKEDLIKAERDYADNVKKANDSVATSREELVAKERAFPTVLRDVEVAQRAVRDATLAVERALLDQVKAGEDVEKVLLDQKKTALAYVDAQTDVKKSLLTVKEAQLGVQFATNKVAEAQTKVVGAQEDYLKLQTEQVASFQKVADKSDELASAQSKLNKVIRETSSDSKDALSALKNLRDAQVDIRSSVLAVADAQAKLNDARKNVSTGVDGKTSDELRREVTRAEIDLTRARNSVIDANDKSRQARSDIGFVGFDQAEKRASAVKDVIKSERELNSAQKDTTVFASKYHEAQTKIVGALLDVKQAELDRAKQVLEVEFANIAVLKSNVALSEADLARHTIITSITDALLKQREAELSVVKSREAVSDSEFAVSTASNKVLDARLDLDKQRIKIESALYDAEKVRADGLTDLNRRREDDIKTLAAALTAITTAEDVYKESVRKVVAAKKDEIEATRLIGVAEGELADYRKASEKADAAVLKAHETLKDAKQDLIDRTSDLTDLEKTQAKERLEVGVPAAEKVREADKLVAKARQDIADAQKNVNSELKDYDLAKAVATNVEEAKTLKHIQDMVAVVKNIKDPKVQKDLGQALFDGLVSKITDPVEVKKATDVFKAAWQNAGLSLPLFAEITADGNIGLTSKYTRTPNGESEKRITASSLVSSSTQIRAAGQVSGREFGGPVSAGTPYLVQEKRPEFYENKNGIFPIPGGKQVTSFPKDGNIIPSDKALADRLGQGYVDNSTHTYTIQTGATDPEIAAKRFFELSRRESLRNRGR